ncbi:hypothetical protein L0F63_003166 [Massospora cicadina]|nr:hypothetical protein L0F63_003166 [Massospora cicadina]
MLHRTRESRVSREEQAGAIASQLGCLQGAMVLVVSPFCSESTSSTAADREMGLRAGVRRAAVCCGHGWPRTEVEAGGGASSKDEGQPACLRLVPTSGERRPREGGERCVHTAGPTAPPRTA